MTRAIAALAGVLLVLAPAAAAAQGGGETWRTAWGDPDLQGTWTNTTTTPMERPSEYEGRTALTDEERAELDALAASRRDREPPPGKHGRVQQLLGRERATLHPDLARDRSARRAASRPDRAGARARRRGGRIAQRRTRLVHRPEPLRPVHHARPAGRDDSRLLQPQLPDPPDARPRGHPGRDDPRRAHHPAGRSGARARGRRPVAGPFARPLGGRDPWWSRPPASAPGRTSGRSAGGCTSCWPRASSSTSSSASRAWTPTPSTTGSPSTTRRRTRSRGPRPFR